jgi:AcrR family transcriptional regulator
MQPTRTRILAASSRLYLEGGDDVLSMRRVADRIGVSATAIYRHFTDRAELVRAVVDDAFAVFESYLARVPPGRGPRARLRRFMRQYLDFVIEKPRLFEVLFLRPRPGMLRYPEGFIARTPKSFAQLHDIVRTCAAAGVLRSDLDSREVALTIWTHGHGFASHYWVGLFGTDLTRVRALFDRSMDLMLEGLAP